MSSIDTTKRDVSEYDEVVQGSIKTPKYCLTYLNDTNNKKEDDRYNSDHDKDTKSDDHKYASGHSFDKFFEFYRCFPSKVTKMNRNVINDKIYCVWYEDGDEEYLTEIKLALRQVENDNIYIRNVGFRFINFYDMHWYWEKVIKELPDEKVLCEFNNCDIKKYTVK